MLTASAPRSRPRAPRGRHDGRRRRPAPQRLRRAARRGAQRERLPELAEGCGPSWTRWARTWPSARRPPFLAPGVMSAVGGLPPPDRDGSLAKVLRCAEAHLRFWKPAAGVRLPSDTGPRAGRAPRAAARGRRRRGAAEVAQADGLSPSAAMATQLARALAAAYPSGRVDAAAHARCARGARRRRARASLPRPRSARARTRRPAGNGEGHAVVPLAQIPGLAGGGGALGRGESSDDSRSVASSSWHTLARSRSAAAAAAAARASRARIRSTRCWCSRLARSASRWGRPNCRYCCAYSIIL